MNLRKRKDNGDEAHTSALNDILFILVFFFLIISTLANPNLIKVTLPKASSETKARQTVVVTVDSLRNFYVGTKPVSPDSLQSVLSAALTKAGDTEPTVVINGDALSRHGDVLQVLKAAKALKAKAVVAVENQQ